jgi:predicted Zn finger-like uncharacterized protein
MSLLGPPTTRWSFVCGAACDPRDSFSMNLTCPACSARYSVPDEKVQGKRAKMSCKRCGHKISIDGTQLAPNSGSRGDAEAPVEPQSAPLAEEPAPGVPLPSPPQPAQSAPQEAPATTRSSAPTQAPPTSADAGVTRPWHLAQPSGARSEHSLPELLDAYATSSVEPGALVWREGMPNWLPPYDVPEIVSGFRQRGIAMPGVDTLSDIDEYTEDTRLVASNHNPLALDLAARGLLDTPDLTHKPQFLDPHRDTPLDVETAAPDDFEDEATRTFDSASFSQAPSTEEAAPADFEDEQTRVYAGPSSELAQAPSTLREPKAQAPVPPTSHAFVTERAPDLPQSSGRPAPTIERIPVETSRSPLAHSVRAHAVPKPLEARVPAVTLSAQPKTIITDDVASSRTITSWQAPELRLPSPFPAAGTPSPLPAAPLSTRATTSDFELPGVGEPTRLSQRPSLTVRRQALPKQKTLTYLLAALVLVLGATTVAFIVDPSLFGSESSAHAASPAAAPAFSPEAAGVALADAASVASRCKMPDGPTGAGRVHVKYQAQGSVESANISAPYAGTDVGECVLDVFKKTRVPAFTGQPVVVGKNFTID